MLALERDQQAEDIEQRQTTTLRVLKDRVTGQATGKTFKLGYDPVSGLSYPIENSGFGPVEDGSPLF
jgi:twinkle protein